jgi:hypothetical protein
MCHCINGFPCTSSIGLGVVSVKGRMRSPRPAAKTMALAKPAGRVLTQSLGARASKFVSTVFTRMPLCCHAVGLAQAHGQ